MKYPKYIKGFYRTKTGLYISLNRIVTIGQGDKTTVVVHYFDGTSVVIREGDLEGFFAALRNYL